MSDEIRSDAKARALELVRQVADHKDDLSETQLKTLVDAVEHDLDAVPDSAKLSEERLAKVEIQTRLLAEAVIAITEPALAVAPAVRAVKAEM